MSSDDSMEKAAKWIKDAQVLYILAGAGMGVSSGLGTFRGANAGIWPPLQEKGIEFPMMSCPDCFRDDHQYGGPTFAWSFWKWRTDAYTSVPLHAGYGILEKWARSKEDPEPQGEGGFPKSFVFTSNIDGHFLRLAYFADRVVECHGTVTLQQCQRGSSCSHRDELWPTDLELVRALQVDPTSHCVTSPLPKCAGDCGMPSRPAVMMFGDWQVNTQVIDAQEERLSDWTRQLRAAKPAPRCCVIEIGAGTAIPTVRHTAQTFAKHFNAPLIRINPEAPDIPASLNGVGIPLGGLEALERIDQVFQTL